MSEDHTAIGLIFIWVCWLLPQALVILFIELWLTVIPVRVLFQSRSVLISVPGLLLETVGSQSPVSCALENLRTGPFPHHSPQGRADPLPWRSGPSSLVTGEPAPKPQWPWENWPYCWLPQRETWHHPPPCMWGRWPYCHVLGISGLDPHLRVAIPMESWTEQLSYYPNPHSRIWIGPPQHIPYLWPAEVHEVISVLCNHISKIFKTLGKRRISEKRWDEGSSINGVS